MFELVQITAQYSNAVLLAVLPHVTDFAQRLDLPIEKPVTVSQVQDFKCSPRHDDPGGRLILTNGHEFSFVNGRVGLYRSPRSFFSLQDPKQVPSFYGHVNISDAEAVGITKRAFWNLGYTNLATYPDKELEVTGPSRNGTNVVPRYRIKWGDTKEKSFDGQSRRTMAEVEIDASTKQIHMVYLLSPTTWRPALVVDVHPPLAQQGPESRPGGKGRQILPVNQAYSKAFLVAILPQLSDYLGKARFPAPIPITAEDIDITRYTCGVLDGGPYAQVWLKTGYRLNYSHGQVIACYSPDASYVPGEPQRRVEDFLGVLNMSTNEAVALVRETVGNLGYSMKALRMDESPVFASLHPQGTNTFARYFLNWVEPKQAGYRLVAEVDASKKTLKSLYINDRINTNIWREPPRVDAPLQPPKPGED
jgi:hypothetical protein